MKTSSIKTWKVGMKGRLPDGEIRIIKTVAPARYVEIEGEWQGQTVFIPAQGEIEHYNQEVAS